LISIDIKSLSSEQGAHKIFPKDDHFPHLGLSSKREQTKTKKRTVSATQNVLIIFNKHSLDISSLPLFYFAILTNKAQAFSVFHPPSFTKISKKSSKNFFPFL
jgi:hypothetical protein